MARLSNSQDMAAPNKRPLEDNEDAPAAKRGRGRPRNDPNAPLPETKDPNASKRGRGRPPKAASAAAPPPPRSGRGRGRPKKDSNDAPPPPPAKSPSAPARGRGRPKKDSNAEPSASLPKKSAASPQGRGRPRKDTRAASAPSKNATAPTRGRGRPRKSDAVQTATVQPKAAFTKGRGRPKKTDTGTPKAGASSSNDQAPKTEGKPGASLWSIIGTYEMKCDEVEGNWPDSAENMRLSIRAQPSAVTSLVASFNLGILEGIMLLAADKDKLELVCRQMTIDGKVPAEKATVPFLAGLSVYFTWRGRSTGDEDTVHTGSGGDQKGILKFKDDKCTSFKGVGSFPALGAECSFTGTKIDEDADDQPDPWGNFSEEAYEEANRRRWA